MYYKGAYDFIDSSIMLKRLKPHPNYIPMTPNLSRFSTGDGDLALMANFGMEMMKFLPDFEQMIYAGEMIAKEGEGELILHGYDEEATRAAAHGGFGRGIVAAGSEVQYETWVTDEWWQAYNEYGLTIEEAEAYAALAGISDLDDRDGDGRITNADTIIWANDFGELDGFSDFRGENENDVAPREARDKRWIAGQHHRSGSLTPFADDGVGAAGSGVLKGFKNIQRTIDANDWNHINGGIGAGAVSAAEDRSYFLQTSEFNPDFNFLTAIGSSWGEVQALLNRPPLAGKSFYQIVMDPAEIYKALDAREATLLIAAMYEARERGWACTTNAFGDVADTRSDEAMIASIDEFVLGHNPMQNHHALSLFPMFLEMQHSYINQLTMFYEKNNNDGYNVSVLDEERFYEFSCWAGTQTYKHVKKGSTDGEASPGILYQYRNRFDEDSPRYQAVNELIDRWFGAANVENGRPVYERYGDITDGGSWINLAEEDEYTLTANSAGDAPAGTTVRSVWDTGVTNASYGWDRKWSNNRIYIRTDHEGGDEVGGALYVQPNNNGGRSAGDMVHDWTMLHQLLYGDESKLNPNFRGDVHPNYLLAQFSGLGYSQIVGGSAFASNWVVHAMGMYIKYGQQLDLLGVTQLGAKKRQNKAIYKMRKADYRERLEEVLDEEAIEEKLAMKKINAAQNERKKDEQKAKQRSKSNDAKMGSREYSQSLRRLRQRLLRASGKHKAWLKKVKKDTK